MLDNPDYGLFYIPDIRSHDIYQNNNVCLGDEFIVNGARDFAGNCDKFTPLEYMPRDDAYLSNYRLLNGADWKL